MEFSIDEADQSKVVRVGAFLSDKMQRAIVDFLKQNMSTFAWATSDMKGINPAITSHEWNVDPTIRPIRQKRRKLGPELSKAVNEEVERLLAAGSIAEVDTRSGWLTRPSSIEHGFSSAIRRAGPVQFGKQPSWIERGFSSAVHRV